MEGTNNKLILADQSTELQLLKDQLVFVVEMQNKPAIAKLVEQVKIKDYPQEMQNANTYALIYYCLNLLAITAKTFDKEILKTTFDFINTKLTKYTYEEIKEAFKMYVNLEFNMEVFRELNSVVFSKVMAKWDEHKNNTLNAYYAKRAEQRQKPKNELSMEQKFTLTMQGLKNCITEFINTGDIIAGYSWCYDLLTENGLLTPSVAERKKAYSDAVTELTQSAKQQPKTIREILLKQLEEEKAAPAVTRAKNNLLMAYFNKQLEGLQENATNADAVDLIYNNLYEHIKTKMTDV